MHSEVRLQKSGPMLTLPVKKMDSPPRAIWSTCCCSLESCTSEGGVAKDDFGVFDFQGSTRLWDDDDDEVLFGAVMVMVDEELEEVCPRCLPFGAKKPAIAPLCAGWLAGLLDWSVGVGAVNFLLLFPESRAPNSEVADEEDAGEGTAC